MLVVSKEVRMGTSMEGRARGRIKRYRKVEWEPPWRGGQGVELKDTEKVEWETTDYQTLQTTVSLIHT